MSPPGKADIDPGSHRSGQIDIFPRPSAPGSVKTRSKDGVFAGVQLTPYNPNMDVIAGSGLDPTTALAVLNAQVQAQAAFISYLDDFKLMMWVTLAVIPLLAFMRTPRNAAAAGGGAAATME